MTGPVSGPAGASAAADLDDVTPEEAVADDAPTRTPSAPGPGVTPRSRRERLGRLAVLVPGGAPARRRGPRTRTRPRPERTTVGVLLSWGLMLPGLLILGFGIFLLGATRLEASRTQDVLYGDLATSLAEATVPVSGIPAPGTPLGILRIPALGVEQVFVQGSASEQTMLGPGLRRDTVLPGQAGTSVLVGRRATYGAPFHGLDRLLSGDTLEVATGQGTFTYRVDVIRTSDAPASKVTPVPSRLTLVTSDPVLTPNRQLVVSAALVGTPQATATGTAAGAAAFPDDAPGEGSSGRGVALLLWCQALLLVTVLVTWAAVRLPRRAVWIGAVPVLLAVLWNVYENLAVLLPNTL